MQDAWRHSASSKFAFFSLQAIGPSWRRLQGLAWQGYVTKYVTKWKSPARAYWTQYSWAVRTGSIPRSLLRILSHHDTPNIRPIRLTHIFHFLCVFASGYHRSVCDSKVALSLHTSVVRTSNFIVMMPWMVAPSAPPEIIVPAVVQIRVSRWQHLVGLQISECTKIFDGVSGDLLGGTGKVGDANRPGAVIPPEAAS